LGGVVLQWVDLVFLIGVGLFLLPFFSEPALAQEDSSLEKIKEPLDKIYDAIKVLVSGVALIILTIAGARFMFSGDNLQAREAAKSMLGYAIIGLVIVWVAPFVVEYLSA
jgi:type IV secretory pathway VirB2 component (pilin)